MTDDAKPQKALPGMLPPIPNDLVRRVGEALYGEEWVSAVARDLGVSRLTPQRWKDDKTRVTPFIAPELASLLEARHAAITAALLELKPFVAAAEQTPR